MFLIGCATTNNIPLPKVAKKTIPGGYTENWRYIGHTPISINEINDTSITDTDNVESFQDRRTLKGGNIKYIITDNIVNCNEELYKIISASTYNMYGVKIEYIELNTDWLSIDNNQQTVIHKEFSYVCKGILRNLGY